MTLLEEAVRLSQWFLVFPLHTPKDGICSCKKGVDCHSPGKHPRTENGFKDGTQDIDTIKRWWKRWPDANIGIWCKGMIVVDIDPRNGGDKSLETWFETLADKHGFETLTARTGGGGTHYFFQAPDDKAYDAKPASGIEIKSVGGLVVAAPSLHASGKLYEWVDLDEAINPPPPWLLDAIAVPEPVREVHPFTGTSSFNIESFIAKHKIPVKAPREAKSIGGLQYDIIGDCPFQPGYNAGGSAIGVMPNGALWFHCFCGDHDPRTWADFRRHYEPNYAHVRQAAAWQPADEDAPPAPETDGLDLIDKAIKSGDPKRVLGVANILATLNDADYQLFRLTIKDVYGNRLSVLSLDKAVDSYRTETSTSSENETASSILAKNHIINDTGNLYIYNCTHWHLTQDEQLKQIALREEGEKKSSAKSRKEIVDFIRSKTYHPNLQWRRLTPSEIPVGNGVLDLNTMDLRPHRPEDYLKSSIPWGYSPKAQCPQLMRCLDTYFGGDDDGEAKMNTLQEFFGYCLMPHARYKKALICYGESDCGKSTIPYLLRILFGQENVTAVGVEHMDDPRKRAPLLGKLVNLLTEITSDAMIADGGFKTLVSTEEPILFDPKHVAPIMDVPICKHVIVTNILPKVSDRSEGTYNRMLLLHFNHVIPKSEQDTTVWDRLRQEIEGILLWSIEGATRLLKNNGRFTDPGVAEVAEYKKDQNPIHAFIEDQCECDPASGKYGDPNYRIHMPVFVDRFRAHNGGRWTPQQVAAVLRSAGYDVTKNAVWIGDVRARAVLGIRFAKY